MFKHGCNDFYAASGNNVGGMTLLASEITVDPQFVTPVSNLNLQQSSPARKTGCFQTPGGYATNYLDMGALQSLQAGGGGVASVGIIGGGL